MDYTLGLQTPALRLLYSKNAEPPDAVIGTPKHKKSYVCGLQSFITS